MAAQKPSEPQIAKLNIQKQSLRIADSASSLAGPSEETVIPASDLTFSLASSPVERKKKFRLPRIVLQDKKKPDFDVKSCIEIDPHIPHNDREIHEYELTCCPPCDPEDGKGSKYIVERSDWTPLMKAEPGDLACFLAGCPPGSVCEKHSRRRPSVNLPNTFRGRQANDGLAGTTRGLARDAAKVSLAIQGVKLKPNTPSERPGDRGSDGHTTNSQNTPQKSGSLTSPTSGRLRSDSEVRASGRARSSIAMRSPQISEQDSSVTSGSDAFPHAAKSLDVELDTNKPQLLSTSIVTNFSLGGVKSKTKYTTAKEAVRKRRSETRSQLGVEMPEPLQLEQKRESRVGSVARARQELERRSKSEGPPSVPQSPSRSGTWENNTLRELLGPSGKDLVRSMEEIAEGSEKIEKPQPDSKGKQRSMKGESGSTQPRESLVSNQVVSDDTAPTEISEQNVDNHPSAPRPVARRSTTAVSSLSFAPGSTSQVDATTLSTPKPPSSTGKTSPVVHNLLKPSITESQSVDAGLPLPPVLSPIPPKPEIFTSNEFKQPEALKIISDRNKEKALADQVGFTPAMEVDNPIQAPTADVKIQTIPDEANMSKDQLPAPFVKNLKNIKKAQDLVEGVRGRLQQAEVQVILAMKQETSTNTTTAGQSLSAISKIEPEPKVVQLAPEASIAVVPEATSQVNDKEPSQRPLELPSYTVADCSPPQIAGPPLGLVPPSKNAPAPVLEDKALGTAQGSGFPVSPAAEKSLSAAYWGFVPVIKEAVQDIVEVAVRNAVNEATIAANAAKAVTVRKSAPEPRELAKKQPDVELQRSSMRAEPATSQRDSESTVIRTKPISKMDRNVANHAEEAKKNLTLIHKDLPTLQSSPRESITSKGQENEGSHSALKSPSNESNAGYGPLGKLFSIHGKLFPSSELILPITETVPLDDSKSFAEGKPGWRLPTGWKPAGPAYTPIPPRRSSKQALASRNKTPLSSEITISPKTSVVPPDLSTGRSTRGSRGLRSNSSAGSLENDPTGKDAERDIMAPLIEQSEEGNGYPVDRIGRANTVHWLKELLSNNEPYEPQFTALPPRMRKDKEKAAIKAALKSGKAPEGSGAEVLKTLPVAPVVAKPKTAVTKRDKRVDPSEAFTQTINDLELLMNEALLIARQAADTQDAPQVLGNAAKILKNNREMSEEEFRARYEVRTRRAENESLLSVHESLKGLSDSEASDMTEIDEAEYHPPRRLTPPPTSSRAITANSKGNFARDPSRWQPTGRSSTSYPLASQLPSNEPPLGNSDDTVDKIKSADPRSMPTENKIGDQRKKAGSGSPPSRGVIPGTSPRAGSELDDYGPYSDSEVFEPPQFRTLEFSRNRAVTFRTLSSGKSPRRLSPVKTDPPRNDSVPRTPDIIALDLCGDPAAGNNTGPLPYVTPPNASPRKCTQGHSEEDRRAVVAQLALNSVPGKREVRDYIIENNNPPIQERESSLNLRQKAIQEQAKPRALSGQTKATGKTGMTYNWQDVDPNKIDPCSEFVTRAPTAREESQQPAPYAPSYDGSNMSHEMDFSTGYAIRQRGGGGEAVKNQSGYELRDNPPPDLPLTGKYGPRKSHPFNLRGMNHLSLKEHHLKGFSMTRTHKKPKIARDWSPGRKRFVASVSCLSTSLIGLLVGIYAGETPSIQYYIVDLHHYTVLGNVFFFIGLAIPTFFFWPLPLLHGRKPYVLGALSLAMPLLFPQALAVGQVRSPYVATWRVALILPRTAMGFCLGFANMNFKSMLTDVFGASLQSSNPHQEHADEFDVRRHGGGMGVWLGLWTWSALGSIGVGFMIGAFIINHLSPAWGFYVSIAIIAFVMLLNVVVPETRRSAFRRSVAQVAGANGEVSHRLARGEVKMHLVQSGPKWWGEEFHYGVMLTMKMLRQPGFMVMAIYVAWIYGQMVLTNLVRITAWNWTLLIANALQLLGALMSRDYRFKSPYVAASATAIPLGAMLAIPFQKASILSRARSKAPVSDDATSSHKKVHWSSHMVRRSIFILCLPFAGLGFTLSSKGPPVPFIIPILFAGAIGFLSNLAMAECHGILMETFDTSDLQPGMTGRARGSAGNKKEAKRTNYSSFPRIQSAFAITQGFGYLIASAASGVGGALTRHVGAQAATGVMAGILLILSLMLLGVLVRFATIQIVSDSRVEEMEQYHNARRTSKARKEEGIEEEEPMRPIIIGNPHHHTRRMCLLELGGMSRFSEIRKKNKLVDENSLEANHPNRAAFLSFERKIKEKEEEIVHHVRRSLSRHSSRGSRGSDRPGPEQGDLGGFREMGGGGSLQRHRSGKGSRNRGTSTARRKISE